jgi:hypothetical protein
MGWYVLSERQKVLTPVENLLKMGWYVLSERQKVLIPVENESYFQWSIKRMWATPMVLKKR